MAFGQDQAIAVRHLGIFRIDVHLLEIQCRQDVRHAEVAADVPGFAVDDRVENVLADLIRLGFQVLHNFSPHYYWLLPCLISLTLLRSMNSVQI
jgi:hypothetical protein